MCVFKDISAEIEKLTEIACGKGVGVQIITPEKIVISQWVRFKCRYGCKGYGKHFGCPPYAPSPDETRRMVDGDIWA
jgi:predicted metal-binding protein